MTTSGSIDFSLNARDIATFALRKIRIVSANETPRSADISLVVQNLNLMLKSWQITGPHIFRSTQGSLTLTANTASYTLSPIPYRVVSCTFKQNGRELPMELLTGDEYYDLPLKTSTGIPTSYYFNAQRGGGTLYTWPVLGAVDGETIEYIYQRRFEDIDALTNDLDIPQEWLETVGYALAVRIMPDFGVENKLVASMAKELIANAEAADAEPVFRFEPMRRR